MLTRFRSRPAMQRIFIIACVVVVGIHWVVIAHRRQTQIGDFDVAREFGRKFLAGEYLYAGGSHYPYMPSAAMYAAPLALINPGVGIALRYGIALGCLWLTLRLLHTMVRRRSVAIASKQFAIAGLTLVLASHAVIRDLDDGGPHLILLAMVTGGIYCVWNGRDVLGATWFGLATALKAPFALFVPFLMWKRQWRLALCAAVATSCWIVLPMVWMGPPSWWSHQREWICAALGSMRGSPSIVAAQSEERVQNQALKPAVLRYLGSYPAGSPQDLERPDSVSLARIDSAKANWLATLVILGLVAACCWQGRQRYRGRQDPAWLLECSAVAILTLLLSPATWVQHMVLLLPGLYLIVAEDRGIRRLGGPAATAMWMYVVLALVLNREVLGRAHYVVLLSYHVQTLCMLIVLGVIVFRRPTANDCAPTAGNSGTSR